VNVELQGMNGFELVEMLRPFPGGTTVCIVGDNYAVDDEVQALSLGVHRYLCKPLDSMVVSLLLPLVGMGRRHRC
jgi:DNA-binding response OmpR family regulator